MSNEPQDRVCGGDSAEEVLAAVTAALSGEATSCWARARVSESATRDVLVFRIRPDQRLLIAGRSTLAGELSRLLEAGHAPGWAPVPLPPTRTRLDSLAGLFRELSGSIRYSNQLLREGFAYAEELAALPDDCLRELPHATDRLLKTVHLVLAEAGLPQAGSPQPHAIPGDRVSILEERITSLEEMTGRFHAELINLYHGTGQPYPPALTATRRPGQEDPGRPGMPLSQLQLPDQAPARQAGAREVVCPLDGDAVTLRPCPPWCTEERHFADDEIVYADHGYHHYGTEVEVPTSYPFLGLTDGAPTIVRAVLKSWTHPLDAEPGPARVELNLGTATERTDSCVEMTPGEARAVAQALLDLADTAEQTIDSRP